MINEENFDGLDIYEKYPYLIRYSLDELKDLPDDALDTINSLCKIDYEREHSNNVLPEASNYSGEQPFNDFSDLMSQIFGEDSPYYLELKEFGLVLWLAD